MKPSSRALILTLAGVALVALSATTGYLLRTPSVATTSTSGSGDAVALSAGAMRDSVSRVAFQPPPDSAIPEGPFGDMVRRGRAIFVHTADSAPRFVGNTLTCQNCHLDAGRLANSAPMWAAWGSYPQYRTKNDRVNTMADRIAGCFRFSMNGTAPPYDSDMIRALESYFYWLATGAPSGRPLVGAGYEELPEPAQSPDSSRGAMVYAANCALCHGADGAGQRSVDGDVVFPPLWGPQSFNGGAGMHRVYTAAAFIKANMPLGRGNSLTDQQAWDVSAYINSHPRPADPRLSQR